MNTIMQQWLQGRKTYLTCLAVGALLFGSWQKWWQLPPEIYAGLAALATAFLRAGIAKVGGAQGQVEAEAQAAAAAPAPQPKAESKGPGALGVLAGTIIAGGALGAGLLLTGCGSLDSTGVYQGNLALYQTDVALASSYGVLHGFVQWEYDNRAALSSTPSIKAAADRVRTGAPQWFGAALALRDAWQANPSSTNQSSLQQSLAVIQQATVEAIACMTTNSAQSTGQSPESPQSTGQSPQSTVHSPQSAGQSTQATVQSPQATVQSPQATGH